ncbi:MAG: diaminopimelate epimerase [Elusimicrobia bacterium]|nr:diaminopimelate epimerase [Elusimicrobiota bacterium]
MRKMKFWKLSGAGNDFVLLTGGRPGAAALRKLARKLCSRTLGVGADGLLHAGRAGGNAVNVRYFNADGSAAFCGNGSRCAAWWAYSSGLVKGRKFLLKTAAGDLPAEIVSAGKVKMRMPDVPEVRLDFKGRYPKGVHSLHFLNTGVPHAVVPVKDLENTDVRGLGRALRFNGAFGPAGANVDFVKAGRSGVAVRTYERGVEDETLACGTGLTAGAVALALAGLAKSPVSLTARSGDKFRVWLKPAGPGASEIYIQGPARIVFKGEIEI